MKKKKKKKKRKKKKKKKKKKNNKINQRTKNKEPHSLQTLQATQSPTNSSNKLRLTSNIHIIDVAMFLRNALDGQEFSSLWRLSMPVVITYTLQMSLTLVNFFSLFLLFSFLSFSFSFS